MIEILEFMFSSFWTFAGSVVLLALIISPVLAFASALGASIDLRRHR